MATKTKEAAMKAARKALGSTAAEGVDYQLRNTGAGWVHEPIPPANEPAKQARAKKAPAPKSETVNARGKRVKRALAKEKAEITKRPRPKPAAPKLRGEQPVPAPGVNKTDLIVSMLERSGGATSKQLEDATGWQPHSVRGLLGTLRKRGTAIDSSKEKGQPTVYRILAKPAPKAAAELGDVI